MPLTAAVPVLTSWMVALCWNGIGRYMYMVLLASMPATRPCAGDAPNWPRAKNEPSGASTAAVRWPSQLILIQVWSRTAAAAAPEDAVTPAIAILTAWMVSEPVRCSSDRGAPGARVSDPLAVALPVVLIGSAVALFHSARMGVVSWAGVQVVTSDPGG